MTQVLGQENFLTFENFNSRMAEALCTYIMDDRPFLGICLGLQLLFESSEENGPGQEIMLLLFFLSSFPLLMFQTDFFLRQILGDFSLVINCNVLD